MSAQATTAVAVTPHDTNDLASPGALYIGVAGDVTVIPVNSSVAVLFKNHPVGYMPVMVKRVLATGTAATDIVALM